MDKKLHIYPQFDFHQDANLFGNREALIALRNAIDEALNCNEQCASIEAFAGDGEGYKVCVIIANDLDKIQLPYADLKHPTGDTTYQYLSDKQFDKLYRNDS